MGNLMRYDPVDRIQRSIDRLLDWAWSESPFGDWDADNLPVDVLETPEALIVKASLPGFEEKDIDVSVKGDWLQITARHQSQSERRDVRWHIQER
jgi:HSP20 family protein